MTIAHDVEKAITLVLQDRKNNSELREMREYYEKMRDLGLVQKQEYNLPDLHKQEQDFANLTRSIQRDNGRMNQLMMFGLKE